MTHTLALIQEETSRRSKFDRYETESIKNLISSAEDDERLKPRDLNFLHWLKSYITFGRCGFIKNDARWITLTRDYIANKLHVSIRTVSRMINELIDYGYIKRSIFKFREASSYTFNATKRELKIKPSEPKYPTTGKIKDITVGNISLINHQKDSSESLTETDKLLSPGGSQLPPPLSTSDAQLSSPASKRPLKEVIEISEAMARMFREEVHDDFELDEGLSKCLYSAFKTRFFSLEKWSEYLKQKVTGYISNSKRFLFYLVKYPVIDAFFDRLNKKDKAMKPKEIGPEKKDITLELLRGIYAASKTDTTDPIKLVYQRFREMYGDATFSSWFSRINVFQKDPKTLIFETSSFVEDYFCQNYDAFLTETGERFNIEWRV